MTLDPGDPVLEVRGVHRFYRSGDDAEVAALKDVTFSLAPGEFVAVVGPSGSGKSTLLNIMAGLEDPDGGSVLIRGQRLSHRDRAEQAVWRGAAIGVLTQGSGLLNHLAVGENVELAEFLRRRGRRSRGARPLVLGRNGSSSGAPGTLELLEMVGLGTRRGAQPSTLSGGETARANLAVALAGTPDVLLADEPTAEISRNEEQGLLRLLAELRPPGGVTVMVTHSVAVAGTADRVLELDAGSLR